MSDIFDGGSVGATAPSEQFGGMLSQPPLSPAIERPAAPLPAEPDPAPVEPEAQAPGMLERKLLQFGLVTMDQLGEAMREEAATGRPVAGILIERGWVTQEQLAQLLDPAPPVAVAVAPEPVVVAPAPEPVPVAVAVPELPVEPEPEPVYLAEVPPEPAPEPVPPPPPPPAPEAVAEVVPVAAEPVPAAPEPEPAPAPQVATPSSLAFHLYIRLSTGERIDANTFTDVNDAREHAEDLVKRLTSNSHVWPHFGGRYIRPEAIISIDVEAAPI